MRSVSVTVARRNWSKLLAAVEAGEVVMITRYGKPVARLEPAAVVGVSASDSGPGEVMSVEAAARLLNVSRAWLEGLLARGELEALVTGAGVRLRSAEVVAFKERRDARRRELWKGMAYTQEEIDLIESDVWDGWGREQE